VRALRFSIAYMAAMTVLYTAVFYAFHHEVPW
jgi:hypothetical protein